MFIASKMRPDFGCLQAIWMSGSFKRKGEKGRRLRTSGPHSSPILRSLGGHSPRARILSAHACSLYCNNEGCFSRRDEDGDKRDIWTDEFMTGVAPWTWHQDVAASHEPELFRLAWRTLQLKLVLHPAATRECSVHGNYSWTTSAQA